MVIIVKLTIIIIIIIMIVLYQRLEAPLDPSMSRGDISHPRGVSVTPLSTAIMMVVVVMMMMMVVVVMMKLIKMMVMTMNLDTLNGRQEDPGRCVKL